VVVVDRVEVLPGEPLGKRDALRRRQVRQLRVSGLAEGDDVADRDTFGTLVRNCSSTTM